MPEIKWTPPPGIGPSDELLPPKAPPKTVRIVRAPYAGDSALSQLEDEIAALISEGFEVHSWSGMSALLIKKAKP